MKLYDDPDFDRNIDLGHSAITPAIWVSSAALCRDDWFGKWWLIETWIFSDDPRQKNRQIIHGDAPFASGKPDERICDKARKVHAHIADSLRKKFANEEVAA